MGCNPTADYGQNKGMALFPRKINGRYAMLRRQDSENLYMMFPDHLHFRHATQLLLKPKFPWEFIQLGNNRIISLSWSRRPRRRVYSR
jgi:predicted GH43/DUF377 family glycosyl hydrolase